jgi:hypothetical protein
MEAQRVRAPELFEKRLQKALRPKTGNRVYDWQCLPPEDPTGHRKAYCRIAEMHHSHNTPPNPADSFTSRGGTTPTLSAQYQRA